MMGLGFISFEKTFRTELKTPKTPPYNLLFKKK
jgi:hypothetical protein